MVSSGIRKETQKVGRGKQLRVDMRFEKLKSCPRSRCRVREATVPLDYSQIAATRFPECLCVRVPR